jgi:hypothetical protein
LRFYGMVTAKYGKRMRLIGCIVGFAFRRGAEASGGKDLQ